MSKADDLRRSLEAVMENSGRPPVRKRTLTFETYGGGEVLVTCAEHPLLIMAGMSPVAAFQAGWQLADAMDKRRGECAASRVGLNDKE